MTEMEKAQKFAAAAPKLNKDEIEDINDLFIHYAFKRNKTREIWTTCCGAHQIGAVTEKEIEILQTPHQREPQSYFEARPTPFKRCPYCGKPVIVKELGRTGHRDNLAQWRRTLVLRWYRGSLWATGWDCRKEYKNESRLTAKPVCKLAAVYRFRPGEATETTRYFYNQPFTYIARQDGPMVKGRWNISRPFPQNWVEGTSYSVLRVQEIEKSPFKYCQAPEFFARYDKPVTFLTACCIYPRKIEMLMKAGMSDVVRDLTNGVRHYTVIKWDDENQKNIFGINKQELHEFMGTQRDIETLEIYKRLKGKASIAQCGEWAEKGVDMQKSAHIAKKWEIPIDKLLRYLERKTPKNYNMGYTARTLEDYLDAAQALKYPLHRENVRLPGNLIEAHDRATREYLNIKVKAQKEAEEKRNREYEARCAENREKRKGKYEFTMDGIHIRMPKSADEIRAEGMTLHHCVAGYADRHVKGYTTILFMRKNSEPSTPWLTIEMDGNRLVQIHGYKNERCLVNGKQPPDPRKEYREFLDTWMDWLKKGSQRNKNGSPKLPRRKKDVA